MSFTRKHYEDVARIIADAKAGKGAPQFATCQVLNGYQIAAADIQAKLTALFAADNPRFDAARFAVACNKTPK